MRSGLTPTDIMHIRKDFQSFDGEASVLAASFVARSVNKNLEELCAQVYQLTEKKLYCNLGRVLLKNQHPKLFHTLEQTSLDSLLCHCFEDSIKKREPSLFGISLSTSFPLIGTGAPVHLFLPNVAKLLHTSCIIPRHAPVANALGAVVGNVSASWTTEIRPVYDVSGIQDYQVFTQNGILSFSTREEAEHAAVSDALSQARQEAKKRGAGAKLTTSYEITGRQAIVGENELFLEMQVTARAVGRISLS